MNVFVLGGTGFIGRYVVRRLRESGHDITVFHRGTTHDASSPRVRTMLGNRKNLRVMAGELRRVGPDVVIDIIPYTEHEAREVMTAFRGIAGRVVAVSSGDVYRNYDGLRRVGSAAPDPWPIREVAPLRENLFPYRTRARDPADPMYDYEKILVEQVVTGDLHLPGTVLRLPMVYGPGDSQTRLYPYLKRMDDRRPAVLLGTGHASWRSTRGYVENVAAAIVLAATDPRAVERVYNVGDADAATEAEWVADVGRIAGWTGAIVPVPADLLNEGMAPDFDWRYHLATDTRLLRRQLGFAEPIARDEALRRTIEWQRSQVPAMLRQGLARERSVRQRSFDYAAEDAVMARLPARGIG